MTDEPMDRTTDRVEEFKAEIAEMKLKTGRSKAEALLQLLGAVLMIAGIVVAFGAYAASLNVKATPGSNVDMLELERLCAARDRRARASTVAGGFVFLRYSLATLLAVLAAAPESTSSGPRSTRWRRPATVRPQRPASSATS